MFNLSTVRSLLRLNPMSREEFRRRFRELDRQTSLMGSPNALTESPEYEFLRKELAINKTLCLYVLFEELEAHPWAAMLLIHAAAGKQSQRVHLPDHIRNRLYPILERYYSHAINHGYATPKIREGHASVRAQLELERNVRDVIRRLKFVQSPESIERAKARLINIASRDKDRFCQIILDDYLFPMGELPGQDRPKIVRLLSNVLSQVCETEILWGHPLEDFTSHQIYDAWFQNFQTRFDIPF